MADYTQIKGGNSTGRTFKRPPVTCDLCGAENLKIFIDGAMQRGSWANMCPSCHDRNGRGLGIGRGQKYSVIG